MIWRQYEKLTILKRTIIAIVFVSVPLVFSQQSDGATALDRKVQSFLNSQSGKWHEWNVPALLVFHDDDSPILEYLKVVVQKGLFWSQYWTFCKAGPEDLRWTTKRQQLTLDKEVYRK